MSKTAGTDIAGKYILYIYYTSAIMCVRAFGIRTNEVRDTAGRDLDTSDGTRTPRTGPGHTGRELDTSGTRPDGTWTPRTRRGHRFQAVEYTRTGFKRFEYTRLMSCGFKRTGAHRCALSDSPPSLQLRELWRKTTREYEHADGGARRRYVAESGDIAKRKQLWHSTSTEIGGSAACSAWKKKT